MSDVEERECRNCGASDWREVEQLNKLYPERRSRDREKTEQQVFVCNECGKEGKRFDDGMSSAITFSGALRA